MQETERSRHGVHTGAGSGTNWPVGQVKLGFHRANYLFLQQELGAVDGLRFLVSILQAVRQSSRFGVVGMQPFHKLSRKIKRMQLREWIQVPSITWDPRCAESK